MSPVEAALSALDELGMNPRKSGSGWVSRCPAHDDREPSLGIDHGDDGEALICCHAGCDTSTVVACLGLKMRDLYSSDGVTGDNTLLRNGKAPGFVTVTQSAATYRSAESALAEMERRRGPSSRVWSYIDDSGELIGQVARWDLPGGKKTFRPLSKHGSGWIHRRIPEPRPLYRLPALLESTRVVVCEGEKSADAAVECGFSATTSANGAAAAKKTDWSPLAGREVVILPDHDEPGDGYAAEVAELALAAGATWVRVVRLADEWAALPTGGDLADVLELAGDPREVERRVSNLIEAAPLEVSPERGPAAYVPFPLEYLPAPLRDYVVEGAEAICCDPAFIALPLLSALGAAIGNSRTIQLRPTWPEPAVIWTVIVGDSGTAKSPALDWALRPLSRRQRDAMQEQSRALAEYRAAAVEYEANKQDRNGKLEPAPIAPTPFRCCINDTTVEGLARLLQEHPRGFLLHRDELAGWFRSFDEYKKSKGGDAPKWLELHGGRSFTVDRSGKEPLNLVDPVVCVTGGIQLQTLARALSTEHRESGLAARLLFASPPRQVRSWSEKEPNERTLLAVEELFDGLLGLEGSRNSKGDLEPLGLSLTESAQQLWIRYYNEHAIAQAELDGDLAAAESKLEAYAARLALVVHCVRVAVSDSTVKDTLRVDEVSVRAGIGLAQWCGGEARRVYKQLSESETERKTRRLVEWVRRMGGEVRSRDLHRTNQKLYAKASDATAALDRLVNAGLGRWEARAAGPKGGKPTKWFVLNQ